jgi:hypothetical protein
MHKNIPERLADHRVITIDASSDSYQVRPLVVLHIPRILVHPAADAEPFNALLAPSISRLFKWRQFEPKVILLAREQYGPFRFGCFFETKVVPTPCQSCARLCL